MLSAYEQNVLRISGGFGYSECHIIRAFVSIPDLVRGGVNGVPTKLALADVPYTTYDGQRYANPNSSFHPHLALFVWMEGRDQDGALCHWIVRFRLVDSNGFLKNQDFQQLNSLCNVLTGLPDGFHDIYSFHFDYNDPLPRLAAVSRRLNSCRDAYFSAADAIQQTDPIDPMIERPKTFHSWAFKCETPSVHFNDWDDSRDLEFLNFGDVTPIVDLGSSLVDRLDYLNFSARLLVVGYGPDGNGSPRKASIYEPEIRIKHTTTTGGYYENGGLVPAAGFSNSLMYQLANWSIRNGYDQLCGMWGIADSWGGSPKTPGPDFYTYWPLPISPSVPYFDDDSWQRTNEIQSIWRVLPKAGADLRMVGGYSPVALPKINATPKIDRQIDFSQVSEVKLAEKLSGEKFQM